MDGDNNLVNQVAAIPAGAVRYVFTNCGATGRYGPTWADVNGSYQGTNLEGNVNMGVHQGIQLWDVPTAGRYMIEVAGAGGSSSGKGAYCRGIFEFNGTETLKILVGQKGTGVGGSGGTFVTLLNNTPVIIAGGAGYSGSNADGKAETSGGGEAGAYQNDSGGGGGLIGQVGEPGVNLSLMEALEVKIVLVKTQATLLAKTLAALVGVEVQELIPTTRVAAADIQVVPVTTVLLVEKVSTQMPMVPKHPVRISGMGR